MKWVIPESGSTPAAALRQEDANLIAPSLVIAEIGNALWKKAVRGEIDKRETRSALQVAVSQFAEIMPFDDLRDSALELAIELRLPIYDCFYLALANREEAPLATADEKMVAAAFTAKVKVRRI